MSGFPLVSVLFCAAVVAVVVRALRRSPEPVPAVPRPDVAAARRRALEVVRRRDASLAMLSRDLRTPLQTVLGFTELALEEAGDATAHLRQIHRATRQLCRRVDALVHLSPVEDGATSLVITRVDVAGVIGDAVALVATDLMCSGTQLLLEPSEPDLRLATDVQLLRRLVSGLLVEAIAAADGLCLRIRWSLCGGWLRLEVSVASGQARWLAGEGMGADLSRSVAALSGVMRVCERGSAVILELPDLEASPVATLAL
ncbi:MAG: HAMP domain-containing histidine kinase [Myxococcales bacterium]|nr:HAMP domain-containing histidine kinase [Myxococcales bacterium]